MSRARSLRVGLTGGLASGKSTVAGWLRDAGFLVVDADRLVAELHQPEGAGAAAVRDLFGPDYLNEQGGVDHAKVGALVFADPAARHALEKAIHPLVRQRFVELAEQTDEVAVLEATLLVEAGQAADFDLVVTVECDAETRLRRAIVRGGLSEEAARARLIAQGDGEQRRRASHRRIDNCDDLQHLRRQVDDLIEELRRLARD